MTIKAAIEFRDVIRVWIEFRAPKKGELTWAVPVGATPEEALEHVLVGRDSLTCRTLNGVAGFGYHTLCDLPEFEIHDAAGFIDAEPTRNIVVHVDHVRSEPTLDNVIPHVRLL